MRFTSIRKARPGVFLASAFMSVAVQAQTLSPENQRYLDEITALGVAHGVSTVAGIVTPPPLDKIPELQEYGINIGMKFMPAAMQPPPSVVLRPAAGACEVRIQRTSHSLNPVIDYENMYGINTSYPPDWGWLADGDAADPNDDEDPFLFHYNTGSWLTIRRNFVNLDGTLAPGRRILFADTDDRLAVTKEEAAELIEERFNIGTTTLYWEVENKLDGLFDVLLDPIVFFAEFKHAAKQAAAAKKAKRYARVWDDAAIKWAKSLEFSLGREITQSVIKKLALFGVEFGANAAGYELTSIPTNVFNNQRQFVRVLDEVDPTITVIRQPEPFEATTLGGEFGNRHFDELRELIEATDNCDRPVELDSQPIGTRFWPVGKTTTMQWCGRDLGPTHANGGWNRACAELLIEVEDTLPPLVVAPPAVNLVTSSAQAVALGRPGVFDLADPDVVVTNDAPAEFPVGRTPVTWTATDSSGNSASATQWVSLKESNSAPVASAPAPVEAVSFERVRIELPAGDADLLDGRYDQLAYRIADTPDNGFFVAPLFPFFIEDHRTHRINPDGTYSSFSNDLRLACEGGQISNGDEIPIDVIVRPKFVSVNDDGDVWVLDEYFDCSPGSRTFHNYNRFAKFSPNADGELEWVAQYHLNNPPSLQERHIFIDHLDRLWFVPFNGGNAVVALNSDLEEELRIPFVMLTEQNPTGGGEQPAFRDSNNDTVQSVVVDRNDVLYATSGDKMYAYDLQTIIPADAEYSRDRYRRLYDVFLNPPVGESYDEEPYRSYASLTTGGYTNLAIDSGGNVYVSDNPGDRVWKFRATVLSPDRQTLVQAPELEGWVGRCDANLDPDVLACDVDRETSIGFACQDDLCGWTNPSGSAQGQFSENRGITMSPDDVLYVTDTGNYRVQRFTQDGYFAGEAVSECSGSCFVLGDFGFVTDVSVNSNYFYLLDRDQELTHIFETTPITDVDDQTFEQQQTAFVTYQSDNNFTGIDTFSFFANDGLADSNEAQVTINVSRNFRAPIATAHLAFETDEDTSLTLELSGLDPDEDELAFEIVTPPNHGSIMEVGGELVYEPDPDYYGEDSFEFVATDAPTSVPALVSEPERVLLSVNPVNDLPVIELETAYTAGIGYETKLEFNLSDADPGDRRRVSVHWGDTGVSVPSDSETIVTTNAAGTTRVVAQHVYDTAGTYTLGVCASDADNDAPLTCVSPDVTAYEFSTFEVVPMVDLVMAAEDSLPKTEDPVVEGLMIPAPLMDAGDTVTYTFSVINAPPSDESDPEATDVSVDVTIPPEMELLDVTTGGGSCAEQAGVVRCSYAQIAANETREIALQMRGAGMLLADEIVTVNAETQLAQRDPGEDDNVASIQTTLLYNLDADADGDGVANRDDAFPGDIGEWEDADSDGIGNNADLDDDGDSLPDGWERRFGSDPLVADPDADADGDGLTSAEEYAKGSRPDTADSDADTVGDAADNCAGAWNRRQFDANGNGVGDVCDPDERADAVAFGDLNGNGQDDVAVLKTDGGMATIFVKDGETDYSVATIATNAEAPVALLGGVDVDGSARPAVLVVEGIDGAPRALVFEAATGNALASYAAIDSAGRIVDAALAGEGADARLLALARLEDGNIVVSRRHAGDGGEATRLGFFAADWQPLGVADTVNGVAVLAVAPTGDLDLEVRDPASGAIVAAATVSGGDWLAAMLDGGENLAVVTVRDAAGDNTSTVVDAASGAVTGSFAVADTGDTVIGTALLGGMLAVVASSDAGEVTLSYYAIVGGAAEGTSVTVADGRAPRAWFLAGASFDAATAGITTADADGAIHVERYSATSGDSLPQVSAASTSPPPPPPPPPPPGGGNDGGGGGGGTAGWLLLLLLAPLTRRKPL